MFNKVSSNNVLSGFGLSLGFAVFYLSVLVLIPVMVLVVKSLAPGFDGLLTIVGDPRVVRSFLLSFYTAFVSASINAFLGLLVAWVLVRYDFPGRSFLDAIVDIPFALPTAVAGVSLSILFSPSGWLGLYLEKLNIRVINTPLGIIAALVFIGFPFVVRTVQPVLQEIEAEVEEAAESLGAGRIAVLIHIILPPLIPAILTGFTLAFARSIGEYGSVIFISGNLPYKTEIAPLLIMAKLDQFDYAGASAIAVSLLAISFLMLLLLNIIQRKHTWKVTGR